jgi:hypothetical protein
MIMIFRAAAQARRAPADEAIAKAVSGGWPKVISNLKSLLEIGSAALQGPYPTANQP